MIVEFFFSKSPPSVALIKCRYYVLHPNQLHYLVHVFMSMIFLIFAGRQKVTESVHFWSIVREICVRVSHVWKRLIYLIFLENHCYEFSIYGKIHLTDSKIFIRYGISKARRWRWCCATEKRNSGKLFSNRCESLSITGKFALMRRSNSVCT